MALSLIKSESLATGAGGSILQVQRTQFTGTTELSLSANTDTAVTDLTVNITPTSTSSIIKIEAQITGEWANTSGATDNVWFFYRDSTKLSHATAGSRNVGIMMGTNLSYTANAQSTPESIYYSYFDTPSSTSQITYKVGVNQGDGGYNYFINRTVSDTDQITYERGISFISVTEIAG